MKEWFNEKLGGFGMVGYFIVMLLIAALPISMLGLPFWVDFIIVLVVQFLPLLEIPLWIAGFIGALCGPQDVLAYIYYVIFGILAIIFIIQSISSLRGRD